MKRSYLLLCAFLLISTLYANDGVKTIMATKINEPIKIDGVLDEDIWNLSQVASDFVQYAPNPGVRSSFNTEVRFLYDNEAIYIAAILYDDEPHLIQKELYARDGNGNAD